MKPRTETLRWSGFIAAFDEGPHCDGWHEGRRVARVFACRKLAGLDVLPYPSGRRRRLYLALADAGGTWGLVGVYKSLPTAKRACEKVLPAKTATGRAGGTVAIGG
jgi:hypothetical protein